MNEYEPNWECTVVEKNQMDSISLGLVSIMKESLEMKKNSLEKTPFWGISNEFQRNTSANFFWNVELFCISFFVLIMNKRMIFFNFVKNYNIKTEIHCISRKNASIDSILLKCDLMFLFKFRFFLSNSPIIHSMAHFSPIIFSLKFFKIISASSFSLLL